MGLEIFDISIRGTRKNKTVEIIIDNLSDYVSIGDCERFSRAIEPWLDELNVFDSSYDLVVSSPGLNRKLKMCIRDSPQSMGLVEHPTVTIYSAITNH